MDLNHRPLGPEASDHTNSPPRAFPIVTIFLEQLYHNSLKLKGLQQCVRANITNSRKSVKPNFNQLWYENGMKNFFRHLIDSPDEYQIHFYQRFRTDQENLPNLKPNNKNKGG